MLLGMQLVSFRFRLQDFHLLWCSFQLLRLASGIPCRCPTTPIDLSTGLGSSPFAHHYLGNRFFFLFLQLLRCFSSLGSLTPVYRFNWLCKGLPHSDTSGSMLASSSPECFVGRHVLLRLCVPRYSPSALIRLTTFGLSAVLTALGKLRPLAIST